MTVDRYIVQKHVRTPVSRRPAVYISYGGVVEVNGRALPGEDEMQPKGCERAGNQCDQLREAKPR